MAQVLLLVRNQVKLGVPLKVQYCVVDATYGICRSLGIANLHCGKVESTKWLKHKLCHIRRPIVLTIRCQIWISRGRLEFVTQAFGGSPKLSSSGLAISMTNPICSFIHKDYY